MENKKYILEDLRELANRSHAGTSFDPEKRGARIIIEHSEELESDLAKMPEHERARYIENYRKHLSAYLHAHSRIYSTMITGPSNFPVRRMEKYNRWCDNKVKAFSEWRQKALESIERQARKNRTPEEILNEQWEQIQKRIISAAATIKGIDEGTERGYNRNLFVRVVVGNIETQAKNGNVELVKRALNLVRELGNNMPKPIVTDNHSVWKLEEKVEVKREAIVDQANRESDEIEGNGIKMVLNYSEDRVQIFFNGKDQAMKYKAAGHLRGWNWSPSNQAWQRKLTENGKAAGKSLIATKII